MNLARQAAKDRKMTTKDDKRKPGQSVAGKSRADERRDLAAKALRENLKRRKRQLEERARGGEKTP